MAEVIVITSGKGGVGKSTATANIAVALSQLGKKVVAIDTDIGLRNLDVILGLENKVVFDLYDVISGNCPSSQALVRDNRFEGLYFMPAPQTKVKDDVSAEDIVKLCDDLKDNFEYILIDCPAGIQQGFNNAIASADRALVVATPEVASVRDADRILGLMEEKGLSDSYLIINRLRPHLIHLENVLSINEIVDLLAIDLIGVIPEDESIFIAANTGEPVVADMKSTAGQAFRNISKRLLGEDVPLMDFKTKKSILGRYRGR